MLKAPRRLYLEDLDEGQLFVSATHRIDEEQIKRFAEEFDPQPFHLDEGTATETLFGSLAASGWHTGALTMRLIADSLPLVGGVIGAGGEIAWPKPTRPGMSLQAFTKITEVRPSKSKRDRGIVTIRCETRDQDGEIVQHLIGTLIVLRRP